MDVVLSTEAVDLQDCDLLAVGFFQDEKPLKASAGWLDWRLNGLVSRYMKENRLTGGWKEITLVPSQGRVTPRLVLLLGLGRRTDYSTFRVRELSPYLIETLQKLQISSLCLSLPHGEAYNVEPGKLTAVLLEGISDFRSMHPPSIDEAWLRTLRLIFAEDERQFPNVLRGVQTAQSTLQDRLEIRILIPPDDRVDCSYDTKQRGA